VFDVFCPTCAGARLIFPGQVAGLVNAPDGIDVRFTCWCGTVGTLHSGAGSTREHVSWSIGTDHRADELQPLAG
jgi:hypothetical protein